MLIINLIMLCCRPSFGVIIIWPITDKHFPLVYRNDSSPKAYISRFYTL